MSYQESKINTSVNYNYNKDNHIDPSARHIVVIDWKTEQDVEMSLVTEMSVAPKLKIATKNKFGDPMVF